MEFLDIYIYKGGGGIFKVLQALQSKKKKNNPTIHLFLKLTIS